MALALNHSTPTSRTYSLYFSGREIVGVTSSICINATPCKLTISLEASDNALKVKKRISEIFDLEVSHLLLCFVNREDIATGCSYRGAIWEDSQVISTSPEDTVINVTIRCPGICEYTTDAGCLHTESRIRIPLLFRAITKGV